MTARSVATGSVPAGSHISVRGIPYKEGVVAGTTGAATIAVWFLILDTIKGRPLYTPTVLGALFFRPGGGLPPPEGLPISFELVVGYTCVHWLVFCVIGGAASLLLQVAQQKPALGPGIPLFFVVFVFGFLAGAEVFAEGILHALAWQEILLGNLLAAAAMGGYLWRRHPNLRIRPWS